MITEFTNGAYLNPSHVSIVGKVQASNNKPGAYEIRLILMGEHEHTAYGTQDEMRALHARLLSSISHLNH